MRTLCVKQPWADLIAGGVIVEVVGCRPAVPEDSSAACFRVGPDDKYWAIELSHPLRIPTSIQVKGRLGLFEVELGA